MQVSPGSSATSPPAAARPFLYFLGSWGSGRSFWAHRKRRYLSWPLPMPLSHSVTQSLSQSVSCSVTHSLTHSFMPSFISRGNSNSPSLSLPLMQCARLEACNFVFSLAHLRLLFTCCFFASLCCCCSCLLPMHLQLVSAAPIANAATAVPL